MENNISKNITRKLLGAFLALLFIVFLGTLVYWFLGNNDYSLIDCLYMTFITISTIGYREIIDLSGNPAGKVFTMFLAFSGIGIVTYVLSSFTAFAVEGKLKETFRRRRMERKIKKFKNHYIVCGMGHLGLHIINELINTGRDTVVIENNPQKIEKLVENFPGQIYLENESTDDNSLINAGIERAKGIFIATDDDNKNLVISLSARQLNREIKIVASCNDVQNIPKIKKAGANSVISPTLIGGMRMASEMIRPTVTSFLDIMLRDKDKNLRIEEISNLKKCIGKPISFISLQKYENTLLLAIKKNEKLKIKPDNSEIIDEYTTLILMTTPEERKQIEKETK